MNLDVSTEHAELQQTLRQQFAQKSPPALARKLREGDDGGDEMTALWKSLSGGGIIELGLPEEHGGGGGGVVELGIVMREAGRVVAPHAVRTTILFGLAVNRIGRGELRDRWLAAVIGRHVRGALVNTDPTRLSAQQGAAGGWRVTGTIPFALVPIGTEALFGTAVTADGSTVAFVVEAETAGLAIERRSMLGTCDVATLTLDVDVDADDSSSSPTGDASADVSWLADACAALEASEAVGGAEAVIERTVEYASNRVQFDRPIGSFQAAQHHVANVSIAVEGARLASLQALWLVHHDRDPGISVAMARAVAVAAYKQATLRAHQLHGGLGMTLESDLHLWSERAKLLELSGELWDQFIERVADSLDADRRRSSDALFSERSSS